MTTLKHQTEMVTQNCFEIVENSTTYIQKYLEDGGYVHNLSFENYKWKFNDAGASYLNYKVTLFEEKNFVV